MSAENFNNAPQLSEEELEKLASRDLSDANFIEGGAKYINTDGGPMLDVNSEQIDSLATKDSGIEVVSSFRKRDSETEKEMQEVIKGLNPEAGPLNNEKVVEKHSDAAKVGHKVTDLDTFMEFVRNNNPELAEKLAPMREKLESESNKSEKELKIAKLKAEIEDLNSTVQKSEAMSKFGHDHGFNKDETYKFIENKVLENEKKIHELEGVPKQEEPDVLQRLEAELRAGASLFEKGSSNANEVKSDGDLTLEERTKLYKEYGLVEESEGLKPLPQEAQSTFVESYEEARGKKNWWGWVKERAKGIATFGFWELHQAERFRSNKKEVAKDIAANAEKISKTQNLSMEDALAEAEIMRNMAQESDMEHPGGIDYENFSRVVSGEKIEENNKKIDAIVSVFSTNLRDRLAKYKNEFGEVVTDDERIMSGFEQSLRNSLIELQDGQKESDAKAFNKIITERLDPDYYRRYVYGALEAVMGIWGFNVAITKIANSHWWLGKKAADAGTEIGQHVHNGADLGHHAAEQTVESDQVPMHDHLWRTSKEWLQKHGISNPTNNEIMSLDKQISIDNHIGVNDWGITGSPMDTHMQQGYLLNFKGAGKILTAIKVARGISKLM